MGRLTYSKPRYLALKAVRTGRVSYNNGLSGGEVGYTWTGSRAGKMSPLVQAALTELWQCSCTDIQTGKILASQGHVVAMTTTGQQLLDFWEHCSLNEVAA